MPKTLVLIPSFNEKKSLIKILKKIQNTNNIIIMDDNSTDGTSKLIKNKKKLKIYRNKKNYGYENNLLKGFKKGFKLNFDYIITFDADGEHDVKNIEKIKKYLNSYKPDLLIGIRNKKNRYVEKIVSFMFNFKFKVRDPLSGLKAYKVEKLKKIIYQVQENYFLVDIIKIFKEKNYSVATMKISSKIQTDRAPRVGYSFFVFFKILKCIRLVF